MADAADNVLQGIFIGVFSFGGLASILYYCSRRRLHQSSKMKQSSSMDDLTSVDTTDPEA
jgi:hypothetical protein